MNKVLDMALERIESLWESWLKSRYQTQANITHSIIFNVKIILDHGSEEAVKDLIFYLDGFEEPLKQAICENFPEVAAKIFPPSLLRLFPPVEKPKESEIELPQEAVKQLCFDFMAS